MLKRFLTLLLISLAALSATAAEDESKTEALPWEEARLLAEAMERVRNDYVDSVDDRQLIENALRGMISQLDPHSAFLDVRDYRDMRENNSGSYGGIGVEVILDDGHVVVIAPMDDTPAQRAGIRSGDRILRIDDQALKGLLMDDIVDLMRGNPGTRVRVLIESSASGKRDTLTLTRELIRVASIKTEMLEPGFAYVRISQFRESTGTDLKHALEKLIRDNPTPMQGLVIDLRNNPGGVVNAAVMAADLFLDEGNIVSARGRNANNTFSHDAHPGDIMRDATLVVLVNEGSASASEILAGALQDHQRAIVMGRKTFGKGSVQTILPLGGGNALKLTTARYYTPQGRSIQAQGIQPDIVIENVEVKQREKALVISEADLPGHLEQEGKDLQEIDESLLASSRLQDDFEVQQALNMLKGLRVVQARAR